MEIHLCMEFYQPSRFHPHEMHCRSATLIFRLPYSITAWPTRLMFVLRKAFYYDYLQFSGTKLFARWYRQAPCCFLKGAGSQFSIMHVLWNAFRLLQQNQSFIVIWRIFQCCHFLVFPRQFLNSETVDNRPPYHWMYYQNRHYLVSVLVVPVKTMNGTCKNNF